MPSFAPSFLVEINGQDATKHIGRFVTKLEYESADDIADMARLNVMNPDFRFTEQRFFQPGNELSIWFGYVGSLRYIGAVRIVRIKPNWPADDMPSIEVVGYTRDREMMNNSPTRYPSHDGPLPTKKKLSKLKASEGRIFKQARYSDAIITKANDYGFKADVDPTEDVPHTFMQKVGMTDYEFVRACANFTGYIFWVDRDQAGRWSLHFKNPRNISQRKVFEFTYNGRDGSLIEFDASKDFERARSKIVVEAVVGGKLVEVEFEENPDNYIENIYAPETPIAKVLKKSQPKSSNPGGVLLSIGDFQVETVATRPFADTAELGRWARMWFRMNNQQFMFGTGKVIGTPDLMANQTHTLSGRGLAEFAGSWYMRRVRHTLTDSDGYTCEFTGTRVIEGIL